MTIMRKIRIISIVIASLALSGLTSCKDFLTEKPKSFFEPNATLATEKGAEAFITGTYSCLSTTSDSFYAEYGSAMGELGTDITQGNGNTTYTDFDNYRNLSTNLVVITTWTSLYKTIANCNAIIDAIDQCNAPQNKRNYIEGQARFLRAFCYFHLVRFWGEIPLRLHQGLNSLPKSSVADIYESIIADALVAVSYLPVKSPDKDLGKATKGAAKMLLAKIYMTKAGWPLKDDIQMNYRLARELLLDLKENRDGDYGYGLTEYYGDVFNLYAKHSSEYIFDIEFSETDQANRYYAIWSKNMGAHPGGSPAVNYTNNTLAGRGFVKPSKELWRIWGSPTPGTKHLDHRYNWSFSDFRMAGSATNQSTQLLDMDNPRDSVQLGCIKYRYTQDPWNYLNVGYPFSRWQSCPNNYPVYRYADVLLMLAEIENELNQGPTTLAIECVNAVRDRARNLNYSVDGVKREVIMPHAPEATTANSPEFPVIKMADYDQESFFNMLMDERARELCFEGHRWFDLTRTELLVKRLKSARGVDLMEINSQIYYPIPSVDTNINPSL